MHVCLCMYVYVCMYVLSCSVMSNSLELIYLTVAHQAPLSMWFSRQEHWSGLPFPSPGDLPDPGIKHASAVSLALQTDSLLAEPMRKPLYSNYTDFTPDPKYSSMFLARDFVHAISPRCWNSSLSSLLPISAHMSLINKAFAELSLKNCIAQHSLFPSLLHLFVTLLTFSLIDICLIALLCSARM